MPRYLIERTFPVGLDIPMTEEGRAVCARVVEVNRALGVTWLHSYVSPDRRRTTCVYDAPDEAAILEAARRNGLPVDRMTPVAVLDPYFYLP